MANLLRAYLTNPSQNGSVFVAQTLKLRQVKFTLQCQRYRCLNLYRTRPLVEVALHQRPHQWDIYKCDFCNIVRWRLDWFIFNISVESFWIFKTLKTSKSPGFDNINSLVVKLSSKAIIEPLTQLINLCIRKGVVPLAWKFAQVTPIFKSDEPLDKRNYRPISVVPIFDSVFEKCLYHQLYTWFDHLLVSRQSAFL